MCTCQMSGRLPHEGPEEKERMTQTTAKQRRQGRRYSGRDASERTQQRRRAMLDAALELFAEQGYPATSVKQICRQAGLTERYFYESFRDRHACLVTLYGELADQMRATTIAAIDDASGLDIDAVTRRALSAFVDYLISDPRRAKVVLLEVVGVSADLEERRHTVLRNFAELAITVWLDQAGSAPTNQQRLATVGLVGAVNHLLVDWLHRGQKEKPQELVEICSTLFLATRHGVLGDQA